MSEPVIVFGRATVRALARRASELTGVPEAALLNKGLGEDVRLTRFAVMRIATERGRSLTQVARALGGMNHTSVGHGIFRSKAIEKVDPEFARLLDLLREVAA